MIMVYDPTAQTWSTIVTTDYTNPIETVDGIASTTAKDAEVGDIASVIDGNFRQPTSSGEPDRLYFADQNKKLRVYHKKDSMDLA